MTDRRGFDASTVALVPGLAVIEASAGTGKTHAMVQLAVRILLGEAGIRSRGPRHLLMVTFTRAATAELGERVRRALRQVEAVAAGRGRPAEPWIGELVERLGPDVRQRIAAVTSRLDELQVATIHGFCVGVLEEYPHEAGVPDGLAFEESDEAIAAAVLDDLIRERSWVDRWFAAALALAGWDRAGLLRELRILGRIPRERINPEPDAAGRRDRLAAPLAEAAAAWNGEEIATLFDRAVWHEKKSPFAVPEIRRAILAEAGSLIDGDAAGLTSLIHFERKRFLEGLRKARKEEKAAAEPVIAHPAVAALGRAFAEVADWLDHLRIELLLELRERLVARKAAERRATFDDQISLVQRALSHPLLGERLAQILSDRYDAVLVDEAQDTDPAQWSIFRRAFDGLPVVIVGDPKQAIYAWRGADLGAYLEAREAAGPGRTWRLDRNWRSTADLLAALEQLHRCNERPFRVPESVMSFLPVSPGRPVPPLADPECGACLRWIVVPEPLNADAVRRLIRERVVAETARLLAGAAIDGRRVAAEDIAILVRTRREGEIYRSRLRAAGINAVVAGSGNIAGTETWSDLQRVVESVIAPASDRRARLAAATRFIGMPLADLAAWGGGEACSAVERFIASIHRASAAASRFGIVAALAGLMEEHGTVERLARYPDAERRLTDLRHAVEEIQRGEQEVGGGVRLQRWMAAAALDGGESELRQLRIDSDAGAVQVRTMHVAKGLEYPVVFVPDAWEAPPSRVSGIETYRDGDGWHAAFGNGRSDPGVSAAVARMRAEESQRLAYVALTRARQCCYVAFAATTGQRERGAIGWLLRPPGAADDGGGFAEHAAALQVLDGLIAGSGGRMALAPDPSSLPAACGSTPQADELCPAPLDLGRDWRSWTVFSYSALASGGAADRSPAPSPCPPQDLDLLPAGAGSGIALHALFEEVPLDGDRAARRELVVRIVERYGLAAPLAGDDRPRLIEALCRMTDSVLDSPIPGLGLALSDLDPARVMREWRFDLAVPALDHGALVAAFRDHGGAEADYHRHLARLEGHERRGFLTGVIDLVAEHRGRWYLVDWKSNHLGRSRGGYGAAEMAAEMREAHYLLQYHIYLVAFDRYLRTRLPGWDRRTMLGGVIYPFVRGIDGSPDRGWHVAGPSPELLDELVRVIAGAGAAAA